MLLMAAGAQAAEAAGLFVAVILNVVDSVSGDAWTTSNATAFIVLEAVVALAVAVGAVAYAVAELAMGSPEAQAIVGGAKRRFVRAR